MQVLLVHLMAGVSSSNRPPDALPMLRAFAAAMQDLDFMCPAAGVLELPQVRFIPKAMLQCHL